MAPTRPIDIAEKPSSSTNKLHESFAPSVSRSPSMKTMQLLDDYVPDQITQAPKTKSRSNLRLGLPHKWRPLSDYVLCNQETLKKHGIVKPKATSNSFNVYMKKKDQHKEMPTFYFIKFNSPGSYLSEFEAFNAALYNFAVEGIIPSAHVIYDDTNPDNPPVAVCTIFDKSFKPVKKKPITPDDLQNLNIVECLAIIISLAQSLAECDLHGYNFVWSDSKKIPIKRVDPGQTLWNYLISNPETSPELKSWIWEMTKDIFPLDDVGEIEISPNFQSASPRYCPGGSGNKSLFSSNSSYATWFSRNAFTAAELAVYRDPNNLQNNPHYNYTKFKMHTKLTFLSREIVKEIARLYLRSGYSLCLADDTDREPNKIYMREMTSALEYEILNANGELQTSMIPWANLPTDFPRNPTDIINNKVTTLPIILQHTLKAGHTLPLPEKQMHIQHIDEIAEHLANRSEKLRTTLTKSEKYKDFVKSSFSRAMNDIFSDADAFSEKMKRKMGNPQTSKAYARLFACQDRNNPNASMSEDAIKAKGRALDTETMKTNLR